MDRWWLVLGDKQVLHWLVPALAAAALALAAWLGDRRRMRRNDPDAVGFMPWRDLAFIASLAALLLAGLALRAAFNP